ncbi:MAG: twin-arginine translocation signal domain-containing protein, partial [Verrucomicrobiota bacterium]|nr:twin-arginine translocation signal domain-containing protein [Verrucomicrobiota bacterium]
MSPNQISSRRKFIKATAAALAASPLPLIADHHKKKKLYDISIAEWSLHKA